MSQPIWETPAGSLGTIPEGVFYRIPLLATADDTVYYQLIAGALPAGMQINDTGIIAGIPNATATFQGVPSDVPVDTFSKFAVRAYTRIGTTVARLADRTFTLEVANTTRPQFVTAPGQIAQLYDGTLVTDLQIEYTGPETTVITLVSGSLPSSLTIDTTGKISGLIGKLNDNTNYSFTLEVSDGTVDGNSLRTFSIYVYSRSNLTADNTIITADDTFITADGTPTLLPVLLTPQGSIGTVRSDNFFAFQFTGVDLDGDPIEYLTDANIPGLTLDPNSGWFYGNIPPLGIQQQIYSFNVRVRKVASPDVISPNYGYSLTVTGPVSSDVTWLTPSYLGSIDNGATSIFYVAAVNTSNLALQYQLLSGSDSRLPQGLQLLPSGEIAGRVSFNTFAVDMGTTTFDKNTTTFDLVATFTVNASSTNGLVSANKVFSIKVNRVYNEPYDNLYIQAMPPINDRIVINSLLQNTDIFRQDLLYRPTDPNFGVAKNVVYYHAYGLAPAALEDYVSSLDINHYWKNLVLGAINVAQAKNSAGEVVYEVVYSKIIDDLVNAQGASVSKEVTLPYPAFRQDSLEITTVYPNSLINMRDQVIDVVGQISNTLPLWMTSTQADGSVLGFTPAWVISYAKPGRGEQLAYYIGQDFIDKLNTIDFDVDRYELDNLLTKNWNREEQYWGYVGDTVTPHPASLTTFDIVGLTGYQPFRTTLAGAGTSAVNQTYTATAAYTYVGAIDSNWIMRSVDFGNTWNIEYLADPDNYYTSTDLITWSVGTNVQSLGPAPTASFYQVGDVVPWQITTGDYRAVKLYICIQATTPGVSPANPSYWAPGGTNLATWINDSDVITTWEDQYFTLANWTYATPPGTTFDGNSLQFTAPVDMYSDTNVYDKYLLFPRRNILSPLPPQSDIIRWINDQSQPLTWLNDSGQTIEWTGLSS
jgi:hypothetical protein